MSRLWLALVALLSALSPPAAASLESAPLAALDADDDVDDDEKTPYARGGPSTEGARTRLARAGVEVEDWIARRQLSRRDADSARAAFAGRLLWNLSTLREQGAVSANEERDVRSFARWMLDRKA